jgi:hypothetical protein
MINRKTTGIVPGSFKLSVFSGRFGKKQQLMFPDDQKLLRRGPIKGKHHTLRQTATPRKGDQSDQASKSKLQEYVALECANAWRQPHLMCFESIELTSHLLPSATVRTIFVQLDPF